MKKKSIERLIPGREFHGTVINSKCPKFEIGDHVVGLKHPTETFGTLSEYVSSEDVEWESIYSKLDSDWDKIQ